MKSLKQPSNKRDDFKYMLDSQCGDGYDERLKKLEKENSALRTLLIGYLVGHFLGLLLFDFLPLLHISF